MRENLPTAKCTAIKWVNGVPEPVYKDITPTSIKQLANVALSMPYEGEIDPNLGIKIVEPRFQGMTNAEVMWVKIAEQAASGDLDAAKIILDRVLGKPKQSVESTSLSMTYEQYLEHLSKITGQENGKS